MTTGLSIPARMLVVLASAAWASAAGIPPALVAKARAELKDDNAFAQRRAALFLALNGEHIEDVVDSVVTRGEISFLAISLLGKAALPRVFQHLASGDEERVAEALRALCVVGGLEPKGVESLRDSARKRPDDKRLQQTSLLLSAIAAPKESERKALLDQLAPPASDGVLSISALYLVAVSFPPTRDWGMGLLRKRLARLREAMKAKDWNQDESPELNELFAALYFGYPIAAREGQLAAADLAAFREFFSAVRSTGALGDLTIHLTEWLAKSGDAGLLDAALKEVADDTNADHTRTGMICVLGDFVLQSRHIPPLVERASQPKADARIRVGAIRLLASVGAADERVHRVLKDCLGSDSAKVREEAQDALQWCVDKNAFDVPGERKARLEDPNAEDVEGDRPLRRAAADGARDRVEALLAKGADVNARNSKNGRTPLHGAVSEDHQAVTELLLAKGADVNARDNDGKTPLHQVTSRAMAELLLAKGASLKARDERGLSPLHAAAQWGRKDVVELLLAEGADVNARDKYDTTPLHEAAQGGHRDIVEVLLAKGARMDVVETFLGSTPLHRAAECGRQEIVALLLAKGANVNSKTSLGQTPLHRVAARARWKAMKAMAEFLLAQGADVNATDTSGLTPLHETATWGGRDVAEVLLAHGANVNAKAAGGCTPLYVAAGCDKRDVAALLIARGADLNAKTQKGAAPVHQAILTSHNDMATWLLKQGAVQDIAAAAGLGHQKEVAAFLDADPNLVGATADGLTPLHWAAMRGQKGVVELLVGRGANVNAREGMGMTPLGWATCRDHKGVAEFLRQHGGKE